MKWGSISATDRPDGTVGRLRQEYLQNDEGAGMVPRLTARFWVDAYLARLRLAEIPGFVVAHGDDGAGAVLVKINTLDGKAAVYHRSVDLMSGERRWLVLAEGAETEVDATIGRQRGYDPDLWVIEVEDRAGRHMLDEPGLAG
jgi:hypothetical protein